jgi:hypothetical protein
MSLGLSSTVSSTKPLTKSTLKAEVAGKSRPNYFRAPPITLSEPVFNPSLTNPDYIAAVFGNSASPNASATAIQSSIVQNALESACHLEEDATHDMGVQTLYRESEAQTLPYSPDYITDEHNGLRSDDPTELSVLDLVNLTAENGTLPASMDEVELINKMQEKRAWELSLPQGNTSKNLKKLHTMLEDREWKEWKLREVEMKKERQVKLSMMTQLLAERQKQIEAVNEARLQRQIEDIDAKALHAQKRIVQERQAAIQTIGRRQLKTEERISKINGLRAETSSTAVSLSRPFPQRDIIADYIADELDGKGSRILSRIPISAAEKIMDYHIPAAKQLSNLEKWLSKSESSLAQTKGLEPLPISRAAMTHIAALDYFDGKVEEKENERVDTASRLPPSRLSRKSMAAKNIPVNIYKHFEPTVRNPTPCIAFNDEQQQKYAAVVLLQRLLRGRKVQIEMLDGMETKAELIQELRESIEHSSLRTDFSKVGNQHSEMIEESKEDNKVQVIKQHVDNSTCFQEDQTAAGLLMGGLLTTSLVYLDQERVRREELNSIHASIQAIRMVRRIRECEESGRRQAEEEKYRLEEALLRERTTIAQPTARYFVQELLQHSVERFAENSANELILPQYDEPSDTSVREQISTWLSQEIIPEMEKQVLEREKQVEDRKYLYAAHQTLNEALKNVLHSRSA